MSFCKQLTKLRKRNNITQVELAKKMNVKQYVISSWETGRSEPNITQIVELSNILDVPTDYLLDKPIMQANSSSEFDEGIKNMQLDMLDEFLSEVDNLCSNLSDTKKQKMLEIIKASINFNK